MVKFIKRGVTTFNRTFIAMHPLQVYYLNQAACGLTSTRISPVFTAPLYLQSGHSRAIFSAASSVGSAHYCEAVPKQWGVRRCVPVAKFLLISLNGVPVSKHVNKSAK